jgi:hypothetical protein
MGVELEEELAWLALRGHAYIFYQENAWADEDFCLLWIETFAFDARHVIACYGFVILGMDCHGAQMTVAFQTKCEELHIFVVYGPPNCTDVTAPVDHNVGADIKSTVAVMYEEHFDEFHADYALHEISAMSKRINAVVWGTTAWKHLLLERKHLLKKAFVSTGWFPLAKDGSEDHLIKVGDVKNYEFRSATSY